MDCSLTARDEVGSVCYPDAAWRPRPLEPPVTTATLPSREKMFLKSLSCTWASASDAIVCAETVDWCCKEKKVDYGHEVGNK